MKTAKNANKVIWNGMPTNEDELKEIKNAINGTYACYQGIEQEKATFKEIFEDIHEKTGIPKRLFNFLAKVNYKGNALEELAKNDEMREAYESLNDNG